MRLYKFIVSIWFYLLPIFFTVNDIVYTVTCLPAYIVTYANRSEADVRTAIEINNSNCYVL